MRLRLTPPLAPSYWQEEAGEIPPEPPLAGAGEADVAILGGGFVGLWTALFLKRHEPDCRVVVLEQHRCGSGASGRNGGFVMSWWPKIGSLLAFATPEQALFLARAAESAIGEIGEFCREQGIDAHFRQSGWLWTATAPAHLDAWEGTLSACAKLGATPFERLTGAEVQRRTGSPIHLGGVFERSNDTVQPALLVQGLRRAALAAGVVLHENSGVERIEPGDPATLRTAGGALRAGRVVLATNAWAAALPELRRLVTPVNSSVVATRPLGDTLDALGWTGGESITDSQMMVDYYRTTRDGRVVFGKGTGAMSLGARVTPVFSADPASIARARADLDTTYPGLGPEAVSHAWSGPIDRTYDSLPVFGALKGAPNILYGVGWSGNGVGPSRIGGRVLASLALGRADAWAGSALVGRPCRSFPPEPFRYLGGRLVRAAVARKDAAERRGRAPGALDRWLAGLAPAGLEDKS